MDTAHPQPVRNDYRDLKALIDAEGLLEHGGWYYPWKFASTFALWCAGVSVFFFTQNPWLIIADAVYMAFVYGQISHILHDAAHRQIFNKTIWNDVVAYTCGAFVCISTTRWMESHNKHHAHPNREDSDPDIDLPILAFSEEQARKKTGLPREIVKRQGWLFFFLTPVIAVAMRRSDIMYIYQHKTKDIWRDALAYVVGFVVVPIILFTILPWELAITFILISQLLFGAYMGMIFAPNHKGMEMFGKNDTVDFLHEQVLTSRNIRAGTVTDVIYGGLNYQIEHHLFPHMPRNNMRKAQKIIRAFCIERGVSYHETSVFEGIKEIQRHMAEISTYARS